MPNKSKKTSVLSQLKQTKTPLSLPEISTLTANAINERTLRRWLVAWVETGIIKRTGKKRGTRYQYIAENNFDKETLEQSEKKRFMLSEVEAHPPTFLRILPKHRREAVLEQIRDLWTHSSTALEGNTLTLGDTHAVLGLGLTVSGKPLNEHQEIVGHAKAIDLLYQSLKNPLDKSLIYEIHKAVQTEIVNDIFKPMGAWKVEVNGTYAVTTQGDQVFIEYAHPLHVDELMKDVIEMINFQDIKQVTPETAAYYYAKVHMAIVHIHPFWDGNGRIARLLANILLLKAGLPPLMIEKSQRREYIECLADYQMEVGQLTTATGVWPDDAKLKPFEEFCQEAYKLTKNLIDKAVS